MEQTTKSGLSDGINFNGMILGYINESGYLVTKEVTEIVERYKDEQGQEHTRKISVEEQAALLIENGFKPVDDLDETKRECAPGLYVRVHPVDLGSRISFTYETVKDVRYYNKTIEYLKAELEAGDYKVTKCYEASLVGAPAPYDIQQLHTERQTLRDRINELERQRDSES